MLIVFGISSVATLLAIKQCNWAKAASNIVECIFFCAWLVLHFVYGVIKACNSTRNHILLCLESFSHTGARGTKIPKHLALFLTSPAHPADIEGIGRIIL
jgi:hypothetical protein